MKFCVCNVSPLFDEVGPSLLLKCPMACPLMIFKYKTHRWNIPEGTQSTVMNPFSKWNKWTLYHYYYIYYNYQKIPPWMIIQKTTIPITTYEFFESWYNDESKDFFLFLWDCSLYTFKGIFSPPKQQFLPQFSSPKQLFSQRNWLTVKSSFLQMYKYLRK